MAPRKTAESSRVVNLYRNSLSRKLHSFACPLCQETLLCKQFEHHCQAKHPSLDPKICCVWCEGAMHWTKGGKWKHVDHLLTCCHQFILRSNDSLSASTESTPSTASDPNPIVRQQHSSLDTDPPQPPSLDPIGSGPPPIQDVPGIPTVLPVDLQPCSHETPYFLHLIGDPKLYLEPNPDLLPSQTPEAWRQADPLYSIVGEEYGTPRVTHPSVVGEFKPLVDRNRELESEIQERNGQIEHLESENARCHETIAHLEGERAHLGKEVDRWREKSEQLAGESAQWKEQYFQSERDKWNRVDELNRQNDRLKEEINRQNHRLNAVEIVRLVKLNAELRKHLEGMAPSSSSGLSHLS